jgi:hypothetical protein
MAQVTHLSKKHEALSSNASTALPPKKFKVRLFYLIIRDLYI